MASPTPTLELIQRKSHYGTSSGPVAKLPLKPRLSNILTLLNFLPQMRRIEHGLGNHLLDFTDKLEIWVLGDFVHPYVHGRR